MKTFFQNVSNAFLPFYDTPISIETKSGERQTLMCFISDDITAESVTEIGMETEARQLNFCFAEKDYQFIQSLKRGDRIFLDCDKYTVQSVVKDYALGYIVKAKSSK